MGPSDSFSLARIDCMSSNNRVVRIIDNQVIILIFFDTNCRFWRMISSPGNPVKIPFMRYYVILAYITLIGYTFCLIQASDRLQVCFLSQPFFIRNIFGCRMNLGIGRTLKPG